MPIFNVQRGRGDVRFFFKKGMVYHCCLCACICLLLAYTNYSLKSEVYTYDYWVMHKGRGRSHLRKFSAQMQDKWWKKKNILLFKFYTEVIE